MYISCTDPSCHNWFLDFLLVRQNSFTTAYPMNSQNKLVWQLGSVHKIHIYLEATSPLIIILNITFVDIYSGPSTLPSILDLKCDASTCTTLSSDLAATKTDLTTVKTDMTTVKTDLTTVKTDLTTVKTDLNVFKACFNDPTDTTTCQGILIYLSFKYVYSLINNLFSYLWWSSNTAPGNCGKVW